MIVLNLVINGIPSILSNTWITLQWITVLNLVINGIPSILDENFRHKAEAVAF